MTIILPLRPAPSHVSPLLRDFGGILTPFLGGPEQRINRLGTRFGVRVTMPPLQSDSDGRIFISRLLQARQSRILMEWQQGSFNPGTTAAPKINSNISSGSVIAIAGLPANYEAKEGQFFSVIRGDRRYVHMFAGNHIATSLGVLTAQIFPMIRTPFFANDVVELAIPMIEGHVSPGDELSWQLALDLNIGLSFTVMEAA